MLNAKQLEDAAHAMRQLEALGFTVTIAPKSGVARRVEKAHSGAKKYFADVRKIRQHKGVSFAEAKEIYRAEKNAAPKTDFSARQKAYWKKVRRIAHAQGVSLAQARKFYEK